MFASHLTTTDLDLFPTRPALFDTKRSLLPRVSDHFKTLRGLTDARPLEGLGRASEPEKERIPDFLDGSGRTGRWWCGAQNTAAMGGGIWRSSLLGSSAARAFPWFGGKAKRSVALNR